MNTRHRAFLAEAGGHCEIRSLVVRRGTREEACRATSRRRRGTARIRSAAADRYAEVIVSLAPPIDIAARNFRSPPGFAVRTPTQRVFC